jgi:hypothetical protein
VVSRIAGGGLRHDSERLDINLKRMVLKLINRVLCSIRGRILNANSFVKHFIVLLRNRKKWTSVTVHNCYITKLPFAKQLICGSLRGKISNNNDELLILLLNTSRLKQLTEASFEYLGIKNYHRIVSAHSGPWRHSAKIVDLHRYLHSLASLPKFILYVDSDDVLFRDDPWRAVEIMKEEGCKILFSGVPYLGAYSLMPEAKMAVDADARSRGVNPLYINAGVFVAEAKFLLEILNEALEFVAPNDISAVTYREWYRNGILCDKLSSHPKGFPHGVGCDQEIMRYLQSKHPKEMKVDFFNRLATR